jgi:hypothetical protein
MRPPLVTEGTARLPRPAYTGRTTNRAPVFRFGLARNRRTKDMQSSHGSWPRTRDAMVNGVVEEIASHEVFVQTPQGALVANGTTAELPERLRMLLFLINGRRRMAEYRDLLPRYRNLDDAFDMLAKKGFIERLRDLAQH